MDRFSFSLVCLTILLFIHQSATADNGTGAPSCYECEAAVNPDSDEQPSCVTGIGMEGTTKIVTCKSDKDNPCLCETMTLIGKFHIFGEEGQTWHTKPLHVGRLLHNPPKGWTPVKCKEAYPERDPENRNDEEHYFSYIASCNCDTDLCNNQKVDWRSGKILIDGTPGQTQTETGSGPSGNETGNGTASSSSVMIHGDFIIMLMFAVSTIILKQ